MHEPYNILIKLLIMKNIAVNLFLIVFVFLGVTFFSACDDGYTINTKEMIKEEEDLIDDYLALF
jgi:hypothetical protein